MRTIHTLSAAAIAFAVALSSAHALPNIGAPAPKVSVQSLGGNTLDAQDLRGKTTLIFYENKDTTKQNASLKAALERQKKQTGYGNDVQVIAVADVSAWNFWPAKGFVQDAIREQEKKAGYPIYLDWSGSFGKAYGMKDDASNVVLVGPDAKVKLAHAGPVPAGKVLEIMMATGK